jgi:hypothetical protein
VALPRQAAQAALRVGAQALVEPPQVVERGLQEFRRLAQGQAGPVRQEVEERPLPWPVRQRVAQGLQAVARDLRPGPLAEVRRPLAASLAQPGQVQEAQAVSSHRELLRQTFQ